MRCPRAGPPVRAFLGTWIALVTVLACEPQEVEVDVPTHLEYEPEEVATRIRETYDRHVLELPLSRQVDYAIGLYRFTGETRDLDVLAYDLGKRARAFVRRVDALATAGYAERAGWEILNGKPVLTAEQKHRKAILATHPEHVVYRLVVVAANDLRNHGVHNGLLAGHYNRALERLTGVDHRAFVLDAAVIHVDAAETADHVFQLQRLGIADLVNEYVEVFKALYMQRDDSQLDRRAYRNKLRGLTRLILAASHSYQQRVSPVAFSWILDYFDHHILEILSWAKPDVVAEIGACFKLCGNPNHEVVRLAKRYLAALFDPELGFIPTTTGDGNLARSEPRNRLAYFVLSDSAAVHEGPALTDADLGLFEPTDLRPAPSFPSHVRN